MSRVHALLPASWRGPSRSAVWRRARGRRVISAAFLLVAGLVAWGGLQEPATASRHIAVAARDLPAGHRIADGDVQVRPWPQGAAVPGIVPRALALGAVTTAQITAGEPLTTSRVRAARSWPGVRAGDVVVSVPVLDPSVTTLVRAGDHIDVLGSAAPVGADLPVLMVTPADSARTGNTAGAVWVSAPV